ncbi:PREDICTED: interferon-induced transmembrane protein 2 isoform X2 [Myotis brandtii]|uniref:interferon-induced transmembrane protein 2 isoform X2 n=1 Tax=Myotis brandtii TaxID=109478 RepID=UPI0003BB849F|nr:PREDICTED: interferon-induced transmembrane protein 2 isoform X2 [Myotis brandtii]
MLRSLPQDTSTSFTWAPTYSPKPEMFREQHEVTNLGYPQNPGPVMSTVVNIQTDTVVPDHIVWSLFNTLFFNTCCLGFVAFAYSVKSRDRKMVGDMMGAQDHGSTAKSLNIAALVLGIVMTIGLIVLVVSYPGLFYVRIGA